MSADEVRSESRSNAEGAPLSAPMPTEARRAMLCDLLRACAIVLGASILGLTTNALSKRPLKLFDPKGPGAIPPLAEVISLEAYEQARAAGGLMLLDARSESLLKEGIPLGALRLTPESFTDAFSGCEPLLRAAKTLVVICDSGSCSTGDRLVQMLADGGLPGARKFPGGWRGYKESGLPLEGAR